MMKERLGDNEGRQFPHQWLFDVITRTHASLIVPKSYSSLPLPLPKKYIITYILERFYNADDEKNIFIKPNEKNNVKIQIIHSAPALAVRV